MTNHTPAPDSDLMTPDEQAGLAALCAAVTAEIGDQDLWHGASDLAWIIESTLFQIGRLIRTGAGPLTLPGLGTFERWTPLSGPSAGQRYIEFTADDTLLEDAL